MVPLLLFEPCEVGKASTSLTNSAAWTISQCGHIPNEWLKRWYSWGGEEAVPVVGGHPHKSGWRGRNDFEPRGTVLLTGSLYCPSCPSHGWCKQPAGIQIIRTFSLQSQVIYYSLSPVEKEKVNMPPPLLLALRLQNVEWMNWIHFKNKTHIVFFKNVHHLRHS